MNKFKAYTLTVLLSTFSFAQTSHAANVAPPIEEQVQQAAQWFSGFFNNAQQVANTPQVPSLTMSNCPVQLVGGSFGSNTENIYLEQYINGSLLRVRFYLFDQLTSGVELGVYRYFNQTPLLGLCKRPINERVIDFSNINPVSCDLQLAWQENLYQGNNAPGGCPSTFPPGGKVVSYLSLGETDIYSLDQIFLANGDLFAGTPIEFRRVSIPEPSFILGLLFFGVLITVSKKHPY